MSAATTDPALDALLDARAVEQVVVAYFDRVDAADPEGAAALFAPDATVEIMTGKVLVGRERFAHALGRVLAQYERTSHHASNIAVEVTGDEARVVAYVYAFHRMRDTGRPWHLWARIVDRLARTAQRDGGTADPLRGWEITEHVLHGVDSDPRWDAIEDSWYRGHPGRLR